METIIDEVTQAFDCVECRKDADFDSSLFAEEHVHGVMNVLTNKDIANALTQVVGRLVIDLLLAYFFQNYDLNRIFL